MFIHMLFVQAFVLAQSLDVTDVTSLMSAKELTVNGLLLVAIIMLWRKMTAAEEEIKVIRKEKETDYQKYVEILVKTTQIIDENTKTIARLERLLDK